MKHSFPKHVYICEMPLFTSACNRWDHRCASPSTPDQSLCLRVPVGPCGYWQVTTTPLGSLGMARSTQRGRRGELSRRRRTHALTAHKPTSHQAACSGLLGRYSLSGDRVDSALLVPCAIAPGSKLYRVAPPRVAGNGRSNPFRAGMGGVCLESPSTGPAG